MRRAPSGTRHSTVVGFLSISRALGRTVDGFRRLREILRVGRAGNFRSSFTVRASHSELAPASEPSNQVSIALPRLNCALAATIANLAIVTVGHQEWEGRETLNDLFFGLETGEPLKKFPQDQTPFELTSKFESALQSTPRDEFSILLVRPAESVQPALKADRPDSV